MMGSCQSQGAQGPQRQGQRALRHALTRGLVEATAGALLALTTAVQVVQAVALPSLEGQLRPRCPAEAQVVALGVARLAGQGAEEQRAPGSHRHRCSPKRTVPLPPCRAAWVAHSSQALSWGEEAVPPSRQALAAFQCAPFKRARPQSKKCLNAVSVVRCDTAALRTSRTGLCACCLLYQWVALSPVPLPVTCPAFTLRRASNCCGSACAHTSPVPPAVLRVLHASCTRPARANARRGNITVRHAQTRCVKDGVRCRRK